MNIYTTDQVAEILQIAKRTVRELCFSGKMESIRIGKEYRITEEQLQKFIENSRTQPNRNTTS